MTPAVFEPVIPNASGRRPTPQTAQHLGLAHSVYRIIILPDNRNFQFSCWLFAALTQPVRPTAYRLGSEAARIGKGYLLDKISIWVLGA
jgi:hypothetical protein